jgi:hypothetical protein
MSILPLYFKEFKKNKFVVLSIFLVIILSYSVYFFSEKTVIYLTSEDNLYEGGTAFFLLISSVIFFISSKKNIFMILLSLLFFFGAGEEISWGQRILGFQVPEKIKDENIQSEFNIHNLPVFNGTAYKGKHVKKHGLARLTEMNFLYRLFLLGFGILLPLAVFHVSFINKFAKKIKIPVPPFTMGMFLGISWVSCCLVLKIVPRGFHEDYYFGVIEIWEFITSFVIFNFALYFYRNRNQQILGYDIKETNLV